ncbi:MAG: hypothetical protein N838_20435 [Thiohalocapsa sp. PB-PSB1]|mgnify:CR=1 FL=1|jgi:hypothetical protein|nr:MAG: hypothetical protein N838_04290 [Thiohalocapsa sp. PB-PSB1]QQO55361.1 MAG: hypothetical protein N838_20435 [Thiohalocapsa sp. PB-PSB1]
MQDYPALRHARMGRSTPFAGTGAQVKELVDRLLPRVSSLVAEALAAGGDAGARWSTVRDIGLYACWYDGNFHALGGDRPLSDADKVDMQARFDRSEPSLRDALAQGVLNAWGFGKALIPPMGDLVFDFGSDEAGLERREERKEQLGDCRREIDQLAPDSRSPSRSGNSPIVPLRAGCRDVEAGREDKPGGLFLDRNRLDRANPSRHRLGGVLTDSSVLANLGIYHPGLAASSGVHSRDGAFLPIPEAP